MTDTALASLKAPAKPSRLRRLLRWLAGDLRAALSILVLSVLVIVAIGAPWIAPYAPTAQDVNNMLAPPGQLHLLGTDDLGRDVFSRLIYGAPATVYASLLAVGVAVLIGLPVGLIAGYFRDTWVDKVATSIAIAGVSLPHYWLGMVLVIIFSVQLNWLPAVGAGPGGSGAWAWDWEHLRYLVLPAITTSVIPMGIVTRTVRALTGDILSQDFVEALRAKGLRETGVFRHVIKNAAPTALAVMGLQLGYMLGGSILIETVFSWPGSGLLLNSAIFQRDLPLEGTVGALGEVLAFAAALVLFLAANGQNAIRDFDLHVLLRHAGKFGRDHHRLVGVADLELRPAEPPFHQGDQAWRAEAAECVVEQTVHLAVKRDEWVVIAARRRELLISRPGNEITDCHVFLLHAWDEERVLCVGAPRPVIINLDRAVRLPVSARSARGKMRRSRFRSGAASWPPGPRGPSR